MLYTNKNGFNPVQNPVTNTVYEIVFDNGGGAPPPPPGNFIITETGNFVITESGDKTITE